MERDAVKWTIQNVNGWDTSEKGGPITGPGTMVCILLHSSFMSHN